MDRNTLFTTALTTYNLPQIRTLLKRYPHDLKFLILEWWDLSYDPQGARQINSIIKGAILHLNSSDLALYFDLLVPKHLYLSETQMITTVIHDYNDYYTYAMAHGQHANAEYLKTYLR
jgi:hypothetical protein